MTEQNAVASPAPEAAAVTGTLVKVYNPDKPARLELIGIDDQPLYNADGTPMTIDLLGAESDAAIAAQNRQQNRRLQQGARLKMTSEGMIADGANFLASLVTDWNLTPNRLVPGIDPGLGEGKVPFSTAAAATIFKHPKLAVIKDQPDRFTADRTNFLRA